FLLLLLGGQQLRLFRRRRWRLLDGLDDLGLLGLGGSRDRGGAALDGPGRQKPHGHGSRRHEPGGMTDGRDDEGGQDAGVEKHRERCANPEGNAVVLFLGEDQPDGVHYFFGLTGVSVIMPKLSILMRLRVSRVATTVAEGGG